jgi:hypothetical protein
MIGHLHLTVPGRPSRQLVTDDSIIEIRIGRGDGIQVLVHLVSGTGQARQCCAPRLIATSFLLLPATSPCSRPRADRWVPPTPHSGRHRLDRDHRGGPVRPGRRQGLGNPVLCMEGRVTLIDDVAGPLAGYVPICYAVREARGILTGHTDPSRF